jgi:hypothetical protein
VKIAKTPGQFIIEKQADFPYAKGELSRLLRDLGIMYSANQYLLVRTSPQCIHLVNAADQAQVQNRGIISEECDTE